MKLLMSTALCGALLGGVAMAAASVLCIGPAMLALRCDAAVVSAVQTYVCMRALGTPLFMVANIGEGWEHPSCITPHASLHHASCITHHAS